MLPFFLGHVIHVMERECIILTTRKEQNCLNYFACNSKIKEHIYNPHL